MSLEKKDYVPLIEMALEEDIRDGDLTSESTIPDNDKSIGFIKAKEDGVICGLDVIKEVFAKVDDSLQFTALVSDGDSVSVGDQICKIEGNTKAILSGERTALNFLCRLSGIATETSKYAKKVEGTSAKVYDTRKTLPGWRMLEKYAVKSGGGENHRIGLWDAILIKENHIMAAGSVSEAINQSKKLAHKAKFIQVEIETLDELKEALPCKPDIVLLDNMTIPQLKNAVEICHNNKYNDNILIEASGNMTLDSIRDVALTGVDRISVGAITHSAKNFDLTLLLQSDN